MKTSTTIMTVLCVGAGGFIAGAFLLAPARWVKPRSKFARKGQEYKEYLLDNFYEFADFVSHPFEDVKEETLRLNKKANAKARKNKANMNQIIN